MARISLTTQPADKAPRWVKIAVFAAVVGLMISVRLGLFGHRVMPIAFGVPLVVFAWLRDRRLMWVTVGVFIAITSAKYFVLLPVYQGGEILSLHERLFDAALVLLDLLVIAVVLHALIGASTAQESQNAELQATNDELSSRDEEIQRQNEELQSQTEELERQSEELRVSNEELAQRERMLETLLDLSRSLHVGLSNDETLTRICETLGQLINGPGVASAILVEQPDGLQVRCHYGFGAAGIREDFVPRENSFAALVIEQRKTGYLEDITLRPDLRIPQPAVGEPMVSVLATPLLVRGHPLGTVEIYSHERRHWSDEQIALLESLAAQTSISLENAQLFDEIERSRRRLATILENIPVGLAIANPEMTDVRFNSAGAAMIGAPPDVNIAAEFARTAWVLFEDGKQLAKEHYPVARAARGERVYPHEVEVALPTGRRLTVFSSAAPVIDAEGKVIGAVSSFIDITRLKQLQRELETRRREAEEANVRKTRFLAAASHDIRTPANAISLLAELLKRSADSPSMAAEIPQLSEELRNSANALVNLVSNVLDVTRFDTDKLELHETEFPLAQLLEEETRQVAPLAQAKKLILDVEHAPGGVWLRADRIKLGRVLGNLIGNAIKFTDNGGIRVTSRRRTDGEGAIEIAVSDTGIGVSPENRDRIFDEFWQLSDPGRSKGSGLGLSISKRLIEAMGGSISVSSTPGKGSTFSVALPADAIVPRVDPDNLSAVAT